MGRSQNVPCQVTELFHKGVKRKGSRTNSNQGTAGLSVMLRESACQRMATVLDETGVCMLMQFRLVYRSIHKDMYVYVTTTTSFIDHQ
jgi:hypothetical protein